MAITFNTTLNPTSYGFFDSSPAFQADADKTVTYVLRRLGEDILSVELTKKMIWSNFEEATLAFNAAIIEYAAKSNLSYLLGSPTASIDPITGKQTAGSINITNTYVQPNLDMLVRMAEPYAAEVGYGQSMDSYSGSIELLNGVQDYDLYTDLKDSNGVPLSQYILSGSNQKMKIVEVYHYAPVQYVFNSNLASNFVATGLPIESYTPDTRFYVLPLFEDVLRAGMLSTAQKIRKSHYRYQISGRKLKVMPTPNDMTYGYQNRLWIRVIFSNAGGINPDGTISGSQYIVTGTNGTVSGTAQYTSLPGYGAIVGTSNPANLPAGFINYDSINPWARNWIFQYTLAISTEQLGRIRTKFKNIPIPDAELQLNGDELVTQGREDKKDLMYGDGGLITKLDGLTYDKLAEKEAARAENVMKQLQMMPIPPKYGIGWF